MKTSESKYSHLISLFLISLLFAGICGCDSYKDYYKPYIGKFPKMVYGVTVSAGLNSVNFKIPKPARSDVKKAGIFWNEGTDSIQVAFPTDKDTLQVKIDTLDERQYTFKVYTYNQDGNKSHAKKFVADVLGNNYISSLETKPIEDVKFDPQTNNVIILWGNTPEGSIGTWVKYDTKSNSMDSIFVSPDSSKTKLTNFKVGNAIMDHAINYGTLYVLGETNDTLHTETKANIMHIIIPNSTSPILNVPGETNPDGGGRGILAEWEYNDAVLNITTEGEKKLGGWGKHGGVGNILVTTFPKKYRSVHNGKIYQTMTLPGGTYSFEADIRNHEKRKKGKGAFIIAAKGDSLPNVANLSSPQTLGKANIMTGRNGVEHGHVHVKFQFSLVNPTQVSVGFILDLGGRFQNVVASSVGLNVK